MALKLKFVKGRCYEIYNSKDEKKKKKKEKEADGITLVAEEEKEVPVSLVTHVNIFLHSFFSNVDVYINKQQIYNSNGLYAHQSYNFNKIKGANSEYKRVSHCEGYDIEEIPDEFMESPSSEPFSTRRIKMLSRPDGFIMYGKLRVDLSTISEMLYPTNKNSLRLTGARPTFYMISDNPNVSLANVGCSIYTRCIALKDDYHKKRMDMLSYIPVEYNYLATLEKSFIFPARQNQFIQENFFNNAPIRRIAIALMKNFCVYKNVH